VIRFSKPQAAAVAFDESSTDRQAHPHAGGFGRKERIKYTILIFSVYSRPGVLDIE
jgi:hypothetical protein